MGSYGADTKKTPILALGPTSWSALGELKHRGAGLVLHRGRAATSDAKNMRKMSLLGRAAIEIILIMVIESWFIDHGY